MTLIDYNRNLLNIGTVSCGAMTSSGNLTLASGRVMTVGSSTVVDSAGRVPWSSLSGIPTTIISEGSSASLGTVGVVGFTSSGYINVIEIGNYQVSGITVIDPSRNLTNIANITASGALGVTGTGTFSGGLTAQGLTS